ncbi:hypothetical protein V5O48_000829 [Marasmius crinis-equi]|uniref:F-box domain-containing protein n=1 Tax=Marasmius crinis-equi TaxID=585013 RepID=A0ABR3G0P4_9AGAR
MFTFRPLGCIAGRLFASKSPDPWRFYPRKLEGIDAFELAPRLSDATINAQHGLESLPIPWSQITSLRTPSDPKSETSTKYCYLQNTPNLRALFVYISGLGTADYWAPPAPPSLRILTVYCATAICEDVEIVPTRLNPNSLRELSIGAKLSALFRVEIPASIGQTLRLLCLRVRSLTSADAVRVFTSLPALESLSLCNIRYEVLSDLASRDPSTGRLRFLPRLLDLGFYATAVMACDDSALLQLLESRFHHGSGSNVSTNGGEVQLHRVRIHRNIFLQKSTLQQLTILVHEGLHVDTSPADWFQASGTDTPATTDESGSRFIVFGGQDAAVMSAAITCPQCLSSLDGVSPPMTPIYPPSPVAESLANSNNPPLRSFQFFSDNLAQTQARLGLVTDRIAKMEDSLRLLHEERDRLDGFVATYKRILHPIRRLPEDVLREIFRASTDDGSGAMELTPKQKGMKLVKDSLSPTNTPWTLGQISHRWREAAVSYPSLWSSIAITFPSSETPKPFLSAMGAQLSRQLRRSGTSMLTIALYSTHLLEEDNPFLMTVSSHSDRWAVLRVVFPPENLHILGGFIRGAIPNLRKLHLRRPDSTSFNLAELKGINAFEVAPRLFDFTVSAQAGLAHLPIPWSQITSLRTSLQSTAKYSYLRNVPNLDAYFIHVARPAIREPAAFRTPFRLLAAVCAGTHRGNAEFLLVNLNPTRLRDLRIEAPAVKGFRMEIPASVGNTLRHLCLRVDNLSSIEAERVFVSLPGLESLSLCNTRDEVLSDLANLDDITGRVRFSLDYAT